MGVMFVTPWKAIVDETTIQTDAALNAAMPNALPGTVAYTAGDTVVKTRNFDAHWVPDGGDPEPEPEPEPDPDPDPDPEGGEG